MFYHLNMVDQNSPKAIEIGKFYFVHDGSKTGHPGFVVWKDDEANRYLVVRFGKREKNAPILPIQPYVPDAHT